MLANSHHDRNIETNVFLCLLIKIPQLLPNFYETWSKWSTHEVVIFTKFDKNSAKIEDLYQHMSIFLLRHYHLS